MWTTGDTLVIIQVITEWFVRNAKCEVMVFWTVVMFQNVQITQKSNLELDPGYNKIK